MKNKRERIVEKYQDKLRVIEMYQMTMILTKEPEKIQKRIDETKRHLQILQNKYPHYLI